MFAADFALLALRQRCTGGTSQGEADGVKKRKWARRAICAKRKDFFFVAFRLNWPCFVRHNSAFGAVVIDSAMRRPEERIISEGSHGIFAGIGIRPSAVCRSRSDSLLRFIRFRNRNEYLVLLPLVWPCGVRSRRTTSWVQEMDERQKSKRLRHEAILVRRVLDFRNYDYL